MSESVGIIYYGIGRGGCVAYDFYKNHWFSNFPSLHAYIDTTYVRNPRSGEDFRVADVRTLLSDETLCISENSLSLALDVVDYSRSEDVYGDDFQSIRNLLSQAYLIREITQTPFAKSFDIIILARDDTLVDMSQEDLERFIGHPSAPRVLVPRAHWHGGVADRFYVVDRRALNAFGERFSFLLGQVESGRFCSSERAFRANLQREKITVLAAKIAVSRVRSGVDVMPDVYRLPVHRPYELLRVLKAHCLFLLPKC